jgi:hypothetical protein
MFQVSKYALLTALMAATVAPADDSPSFNGFLPDEQGNLNRTSIDIPLSGGNRADSIVQPQLPMPPAPTVPIAGQVPITQSGNKYSVEVLVCEGNGFTQVLSDAERFMTIKQHQGFVVSKTEYYDISDGKARIFHIVYWYQWKSSYLGDDPAVALRLARENRVHYPYVRVLHHQLVQPGWWDANMSVRLDARDPHWETRVTGW